MKVVSFSDASLCPDRDRLLSHANGVNGAEEMMNHHQPPGVRHCNPCSKPQALSFTGKVGFRNLYLDWPLKIRDRSVLAMGAPASAELDVTDRPPALAFWAFGDASMFHIIE